MIPSPEAIQLAQSLKEDLQALTLYGEEGAYSVELRQDWFPLPHRIGSLVYHVPHPDGTPGPFLMPFRMNSQTSYAGVRADTTRLICLFQGKLWCNGVDYGPGTCIWVDRQEDTHWVSLNGALGVCGYGFPNPFLPPTP